MDERFGQMESVKSVQILDENNRNGDLEEKAYTVEEVLTLIGLGKAQLWVFLSMGFCIMASIMETMGMGFIVPAAKCDLELDTFKIGILTGVIFLGIMSSQHLWGFIADAVGRRPVILFSLVCCLGCSFCVAFTQNFWIIIGLRFFSGVLLILAHLSIARISAWNMLGYFPSDSEILVWGPEIPMPVPDSVLDPSVNQSLAGFSSIMYPYTGEFFAEQHRSSAIIFVCKFVGLTYIVAPAIGWILSKQDFSVHISDSFEMLPWRFQMIIQLIPGIICISILKFLPETPKFLASIHKEKEALKSLQWAFHLNTGKPISEFPVKKLILPEVDETEKQYNKKTIKGFCGSIIHETVVLFKPPYVIRLLMCCYLQIAVFLVGSGFTLWYPELTSLISSSQESGLAICTIINNSMEKKANQSLIEGTEECLVTVNDQTYLSNILFGVVCYLGYIFLGFITQKLHKSYILATCLAISGFCGFILYWIVNDIFMLIMFLTFLIFANLSICFVSATVVDLFPTHLRGMAVCLIILNGRTASFVGASTIGTLLNLNCGATILVISSMVLVAGIISWKLPWKR